MAARCAIVGPIVPGFAEQRVTMSARCDKTGRWRFRKWVKTPDGRRVRISGTPNTNTKKAAEHAERVEIQKIENPSATPVPTAPAKEVPTIREYSKTFVEGYAAHHKPSEVQSKNQILRFHVLPWFGEERVDAIDQSDVDAFRASLLGGRSRKTVNNITAVLSSLLKYAAKNHLRPRPVDLEFFVKEDDVGEIEAVPADHVEALLDAARDPRYVAGILLAVDAGLRIGEIRAAEWDQINDLRRAVSVTRSVDRQKNVTSPKSRKGRIIAATPRLWAALGAVPRVGRNVFGRRDGKPISYYAAWEGLRAVYERAGVQPPPMPWHCLRHTFCTELAASGAPVHVIKKLAGHESIETTLRYMHTTDTDMRAAIAAMADGNGQRVGNGRSTKAG